MAVVHYRYKSSKDFHSIPLDGPFISVFDFKYTIFASDKYGTGKDFDLLISNAQTDEQYADDSILIPRNTCLLIRRIPGLPALPIVIVGNEKPKIQNNLKSVLENTQEGGGFDWDDFGPDPYFITIKKTANLSNTHCKEDKIDDGFKTSKRIPPLGYVCHRCEVAGHYIQHCPTNNDPNYDFKKVEPATENPKSSALSTSGSSADNTIPPELYCPLCKMVMRDAAFTKCCFSSFCDKCIRDHIVSKSACVCQRKIVAADILPNKTLRDTISRILNQSRSKNSDSSGTSCLIQDTASAASKANQNRKIIVSPQDNQILNQSRNNNSGSSGASCLIQDTASAASNADHTLENVNEPSSKGSTLTAEKEEQQKKIISSETERKRKRKVSMMPNYPQWKTSQYVGVDSYMTPLHHSAHNPYLAGMYPGFMSTCAAVVPQSQMFTAFPPEKNVAEFGLDAKFAQPTKKLRVLDSCQV